MDRSTSTLRTPVDADVRTTPIVSGGRGFQFAHVVSGLRAHRVLKAIAIPALMTAFFVGYFLVLNAPLFPVAVMPLTAIDGWIPFWPGALPLYVSLWVYVVLAPAVLQDRELFHYTRAALALALVGLGIFLVCPTAIPLTDIDWENHQAFLFLKTVDATGNACPSLHVAFAIFSAAWLHRILHQMGDRGLLRVLSWCWCVGIVYSTLATKQHVFWDVVAGSALGIAGAVLSFCSLRSRVAGQFGKL